MVGTRALLLCILMLAAIPAVLSVECVSKPRIETDTTIRVNEGQAFSQLIDTEQVDFFGYTIMNTSFPSFSADQNHITFTPGPDDVGTHYVVLIGMNSQSCIATQIVRVAVLGKPVITSIEPAQDTLTTTEGNIIQFSIEAQDPQRSPLSFDWVVDGREAAKGTRFVYEADFTSAGNHTIEGRARNALGLTASTSWRVAVANQNRAPSLKYNFPTVKMRKESTILPFNLYQFFDDPDGDPLEFSHEFNGVGDQRAMKSSLSVSVNRSLLQLSSTYPATLSLTIIATDPEGLSVRSNPFIVDVVPSEATCGDGICAEEDCSSCPVDCGACDTCASQWVCSDWSACTQGALQTRECADISGCSNPDEQPEVSRECPYRCNDGIKNQDEEGIDCGGPCQPCDSCHDGQRNQRETDVDCGGPCNPCKDNFRCIVGLDCASMICGPEMTCVAPTCSDRTKNQGEGGVDCGGPCSGACPTCVDGKKNGEETAVDCGGQCAPCETCDDTIKNQDERLVDCGGSCKACGAADYYHAYSGGIVIGVICLILLIGVIAWLERRYSLIYRVFNVDDNLKFLLFIDKYCHLPFGHKQHYTDTLDATAQTLQDAAEREHAEDVEKETLLCLNAFFREVFGVQGAFAEEHMAAKLREWPIPMSSKKLLMLLHRKLMSAQKSTYNLSVQVDDLNRTAQHVIASIRRFV
ncbi:MAG: hypothetical protein ABIH41_04285 [Nanoarchaeota archaeon]